MNDFFRLCLVYLGFSIIIDTFFVCLIGPCTVISSHSMYMGGRWSSLYRANIIKWKISVCVDAVAFIGRMKLPANLLCLFGTQKGIFLGRRNKNKNIEIDYTIGMLSLVGAFESRVLISGWILRMCACVCVCGVIIPLERCLLSFFKFWISEIICNL